MSRTLAEVFADDPPVDPLAPARAFVADAEAALLAARRALVVAALEVAGGNRARAAPLLRVSERTLHRWIGELALGERLDALARERGWAAAPGRAANALRGRMGRRGRGGSGGQPGRAATVA